MTLSTRLFRDEAPCADVEAAVADEASFDGRVREDIGHLRGAVSGRPRSSAFRRMPSSGKRCRERVAEPRRRSASATRDRSAHAMARAGSCERRRTSPPWETIRAPGRLPARLGRHTDAPVRDDLLRRVSPQLEACLEEPAARLERARVGFSRMRVAAPGQLEAPPALRANDAHVVGQRGSGPLTSVSTKWPDGSSWVG